MHELLVQYWQFTLVAVLIGLAWITSAVIPNRESNIKITWKEMPCMKPISIPTKGKGFWGGVWTWIMVTRTWEITKDWRYELNSVKYVIPKGMIFDGASVPKFFRSWLSPMGVLLIGGLVHDYGYKYGALLKGNKKSAEVHNQKELDQIFRDINIDVNGFRVLNYVAYYALRLGGFVAWRSHRKNGKDWKKSI